MMFNKIASAQARAEAAFYDHFFILEKKFLHFYNQRKP